VADPCQAMSKVPATPNIHPPSSNACAANSRPGYPVVDHSLGCRKIQETSRTFISCASVVLESTLLTKLLPIQHRDMKGLSIKKSIPWASANGQVTILTNCAKEMHTTTTKLGAWAKGQLKILRICGKDLCAATTHLSHY